MVKKIYSYVDESGQHNKGQVFIVTVIVAEDKRDYLLQLCEEIEIESRKDRAKWGKADVNYRLKYIRLVFENEAFHECIRYSVFRDTKKYDEATIKAITQALSLSTPEEKHTNHIYVDGLSKKKSKQYHREIKKEGIHVQKIKGKNDERDALIRLADSISGFIMDGIEFTEQYEEDGTPKDKRNKIY